jgi:hypothetical protein
MYVRESSDSIGLCAEIDNDISEILTEKIHLDQYPHFMNFGSSYTLGPNAPISSIGLNICTLRGGSSLLWQLLEERLSTGHNPDAPFIQPFDEAHGLTLMTARESKQGNNQPVKKERPQLIKDCRTDSHI